MYNTFRDIHRQHRFENFTKVEFIAHKAPTLYNSDTRFLNQTWKMPGITLTQEVTSYLEILDVSHLQLKARQNIHPLQGNPKPTYQ